MTRKPRSRVRILIYQTWPIPWGHGYFPRGLLFPTPATIRGMCTSFRRNDFWDHLGVQALIMIG